MNKNRFLSLILIVLLTVLAAVSCGIDTSTVAGNVSQAMTQESSDDTDEG